MNNQNVLQVEGLTKRYRHAVALDNLSFQMDKGEIVGLIGANGAGKTTTMAVLLGLVLPSSGKVRIFGLNPGKNRRHVLERMKLA